MPSLLYFALSNAVAATLLAVLAVVVARFCRRPAVRHALWLLVLLKLVTPPWLPISVTWPRNEESEPLPAVALPPDLEASEPIPSLPESTPIPAATVRERLAEPLPYGRGWDFSFALLVVWLGGALGWWTVAAVRVRRFRRLLRQAQLAATGVQDQGQRLAALLGLRRCPPIVFVSAPLSPMLWALGFSPHLLVPAELWRKLTAEQQDTLLAHELAHLRRRDHWIRRLELLVLGLYWWHPVVWWARRRLQEAEEECCDALVVAILPDAAPAYASALVETVAFLSQTRPAALVGVSGAGQVPLLKRRLTMILSETSSRKPSRIGFWIVLGVGALLLPLAPRVARTQVPEEPKRVEWKARIDDSVKARLENIELEVQAKNCIACHQQQTVIDDKPKSWKHAHDEVVHLLDEIKTQRSQLQKTEDRLRRALDALKRLESRSEPQPNTNWAISWAEALFDKRAVDLGTVKQGVSAVGTFRMTNNGKHPVHISRVRASVPILKATASAHDLPPGESAFIVAQLFTDNLLPGKAKFVVHVQFDKPDRQEVALELRANIQAAAPKPQNQPQNPKRLQELEKKFDELRKEMDNLRREMQPDKPRDSRSQPDRLKH
jgi:beta-lactamase regulating signal transducer with metallopeptidase domain